MATFDERAEEYAKRLREASNKQVEAAAIARDLNELVYSATKKPLSKTDKEEILKKVRIKINSVVLERMSNDNYMELISYILSQLQ